MNEKDAVEFRKEIFKRYFVEFGVGLKIYMSSNQSREIRGLHGIKSQISVVEIIGRKQNWERNKLVKEIANQVAEYVTTNILAIMYSQEHLIKQTKEFEIGGIQFEVGKNIEQGEFLYIEWMEMGGMRQYSSYWNEDKQDVDERVIGVKYTKVEV